MLPNTIYDRCSWFNTTINRKWSFISNAHNRFEHKNMSTSGHFPNLKSIATNVLRIISHLTIFFFCFKIRIYNNHIITVALKSKTFDIFYNLYPLKFKPLRCASVFKQRSDDATSFVYRWKRSLFLRRLSFFKFYILRYTLHKIKK